MEINEYAWASSLARKLPGRVLPEASELPHQRAIPIARMFGQQRSQSGPGGLSINTGSANQL